MSVKEICQKSPSLSSKNTALAHGSGLTIIVRSNAEPFRMPTFDYCICSQRFFDKSERFIGFFIFVLLKTFWSGVLNLVYVLPTRLRRPPTAVRTEITGFWDNVLLSRVASGLF